MIAASTVYSAPFVVHEWGTITTKHAADGTPQGTGLFIDLNSLDGSEAHGFHILNNKLLFIAKDENDNHLKGVLHFPTVPQFLRKSVHRISSIFKVSIKYS